MPVENTPNTETNPAAAAAASSTEPQSAQELFQQSLPTTQTAAASPNTPATPSVPTAGASTTPTAAAGIAAPAQQPSSPQAASAAPAQPSMREIATRAGLQVGNMTDLQVFEALLAERQQLQPMAQLGAQAAPHFADFQQYLASRAAQPAQQQQATAPAEGEWTRDKYFAEAWGAPAWDPKWDTLIKKGFIRENDQGVMVAAPGFELSMGPFLNDINAALDGQMQSMSSLTRGNFLQNIFDKLLPAIERHFDPRIDQRFTQQQQTIQQRTEMDTFDAQYGSQLWDAQGVPTAIGQQVGAIASRMVGPDPNNPRMPEHEALAIAVQAMGLKPGQAAAAAQAPVPAAAQPAVPATPQQINQQQIGGFLDQARANSGTANNAAPYQTTLTNPSNDPNVGGVELAGMFKQLAAQAMGAGGT